MMVCRRIALDLQAIAPICLYQIAGYAVYPESRRVGRRLRSRFAVISDQVSAVDAEVQAGVGVPGEVVVFYYVIAAHP